MLLLRITSFHLDDEQQPALRQKGGRSARGKRDTRREKRLRDTSWKPVRLASEEFIENSLHMERWLMQ